MYVAEDLYNWQAQNRLVTSPLQYCKDLQNSADPQHKFYLVVGRNVLQAPEKRYLVIEYCNV